MRSKTTHPISVAEKNLNTVIETGSVFGLPVIKHIAATPKPAKTERPARPERAKTPARPPRSAKTSQQQPVKPQNLCPL